MLTSLWYHQYSQKQLLRVYKVPVFPMFSCCQCRRHAISHRIARKMRLPGEARFRGCQKGVLFFSKLKINAYTKHHVLIKLSAGSNRYSIIIVEYHIIIVLQLRSNVHI